MITIYTRNNRLTDIYGPLYFAYQDNLILNYKTQYCHKDLTSFLYMKKEEINWESNRYCDYNIEKGIFVPLLEVDNIEDLKLININYSEYFI